LTHVDVSACVLVDHTRIHGAVVEIVAILVDQATLGDPLVVARVADAHVFRAYIVVRAIFGTVASAVGR
jgi:hypothetical protein